MGATINVSRSSFEEVFAYSFMDTFSCYFLDTIYGYVMVSLSRRQKDSTE